MGGKDRKEEGKGKRLANRRVRWIRMWLNVSGTFTLPSDRHAQKKEKRCYGTRNRKKNK